jgi:hypothetical protein
MPPITITANHHPDVQENGCGAEPALVFVGVVFTGDLAVPKGEPPVTGLAPYNKN